MDIVKFLQAMQVKVEGVSMDIRTEIKTSKEEIRYYIKMNVNSVNTPPSGVLNCN